MKASRLMCLVLVLATLFSAPLRARTTSDPANLSQRDGSHDFDFLIGDGKAHVRRLPDRLNNSNVWVEYDGISNHHKILDSNSNFEEFDVTSTDKKLHIKAQTLRLYNPTTRQWSIYLLDVDNGTLGLPLVVGGFKGNRGEFLIRNDTRDAPYWSAMSGSTSLPNPHAWSSRSRRTAARPGKSTGFASYRDRPVT